MLFNLECISSAWYRTVNTLNMEESESEPLHDTQRSVFDYSKLWKSWWKISFLMTLLHLVIVAISHYVGSSSNSQVHALFWFFAGIFTFWKWKQKKKKEEIKGKTEEVPKIWAVKQTALKRLLNR